MMNHTRRSLGVWLTVALLLAAGCGRRPPVQDQPPPPTVEERPPAEPERQPAQPPVERKPQTPQPPGIWQTTWVDPQILVSDSLFTLIRAVRLDSFLVTKKLPDSKAASSLIFRITQPQCNVTITLLTGQAQPWRPLLQQTLPAGHYKLTMDFSRVSYDNFPAGRYIVKAQYCGRSESVSITRK